MTATATTPQTEPVIPPGRNRYAGRCWRCSQRLRPDQGWLDGKDDRSGRWRVVCDPCEQAEMERLRAEVEAQRLAEAERLAQLRAEAEDRERRQRAREFWREWEREQHRKAQAEEHRRRLRDLDAMIFAMQAAEIFRPRIPACLVTLGLEPPVTGDQVKRRFRELAKVHHPDAGGEAAEFTRIQAAYSEAMQLAGVAS